MSEAPKPLTDEELTVYRAGDLDFPAAWFPWRASRRLIATIDARDELIQAQRDDKARMRQQMHDMSLASSEKSREIDELRAKIVEACKVTVTRKEVEESLDDAVSKFLGNSYTPTVQLMRAAIECFAERCGIEIGEE